ncbi:MAG: hypothetical protein AAF674_08530 [Pseudomonadota bacterium]
MPRLLMTIAVGIVAISINSTAGAQQSNPIVIPMAGQGSTDADQVGYATLCTGEDWVVFNAVSQKNGKLISVCMAEGDDTTPSHLTYRYGAKGVAELVFPAMAKGSARQFTSRRYTRPQVTYLKFEFTTGGFNYEITEGGEGDEITADLRVIRVSDGKVVAEHMLTPQTEPLSLMQLEDLTKTAPFDD